MTSTQSSEQLLQDMMTQYCFDGVYPYIEKLTEALTQLSDQQKLHILQLQKYSVWTPLHWAAGRGHTAHYSHLYSPQQTDSNY